MDVLKWLRHILLAVCAAILIAEEWLWEALTHLGRWIFKYLHLARFEFWLTQQSRWVALVAFLIPLLVVAPMNLVAFWLLAKGKVLRAVGLEIIAKLLGMMLVARVFALTKRQLMSFAWFYWLYSGIMRMLAWAHRRLSATATYRLAKDFRGRMTQRKRPGD